MSIRSTICTYHAKAFDFRDPRPESICVEDMIEALSKQCRFTGHCKGFYSNAAHSMLVADLLINVYKRPDLELEGLLHEGNEPYMNDVNSPLKGECPDYKAIQKLVQSVVDETFGLATDPETKALVKRADWLAYCLEQHALMPPEAEMIDRLSGRGESPDVTVEMYDEYRPRIVDFAGIGNWRHDRALFSERVHKALKQRNA